MPSPSDGDEDGEQRVGSGVGGERPVDDALDRRTPTTAATSTPRTADGQNGRSTRNVNVNAMYAASVYVNP